MARKEELIVSVVQTSLHWEDVQANVAMFDALLDKAETADLFVLPEMFTTGFSMRPELFAGQSQEQGLDWITRKAKQLKTAITGSLMAQGEDGAYYNRLFFVWPGGEYFYYDKKHLFGLGAETSHYKAGDKVLMVEYFGWKICPLVCYDLRFPVWSRNTQNYDILLYAANWPEKRAHHWRTLLPARAVENQCYVAACNRIGEDGNGISHDGSSMLIDFNGDIMAQNQGEDVVLSATFSKPQLESFRTALPFLKDADKFSFI